MTKQVSRNKSTFSCLSSLVSLILLVTCIDGLSVGKSTTSVKMPPPSMPITRMASYRAQKNNNTDGKNNDDPKMVALIINDAYRKGEEGIILDEPRGSFQRMTEDEVADMMDNEKLLLLEDQSSGIIGCIKVDINKKVGEWGCLAVREEYQGKGYGSILVLAAETYFKQQKCTMTQLELLAPTHWKHTHKERLRSWYCKMGYILGGSTYEEATSQLCKGEVLAGKFQLMTDADFTMYRKEL